MYLKNAVARLLSGKHDGPSLRALLDIGVTAQKPSHLPLVVLDIFERCFIISLFIWFAAFNLSHFVLRPDIIPLLLVASELLPVILISVRNFSASISTFALDWVLGLSGSALPLLVRATVGQASLVPAWICFVIVLCGLCLQIGAKVALGRSFGVVAANRGIKVEGPYRFVRHPIYCGYAMAHLGLFLALPTWRTGLLYLTAFVIQLLRISREERVLRQDPRYRTFADRVRYRLIPGIL